MSGADDLGDAEPVRQADDRAQIAGVLHLVERQHQLPLGRIGPEGMMRDFDQRQRIRRGLQQREPLHFTRRHGFDFAALEKPFQGEYLADAQGGGAQLPDELVSFGYEQSVFGAAAFVGQRADELYFGFGHGCCRFLIVNVVPSVAGRVSGNTVRASSTRTLSSL